jgi:protein gp37
VGKDSAIEWTDHTFNPWWGCVRVSPGCENCYAETFSNRLGMHLWGPTTERRMFEDKHWAEPLKWNKAAERAGKPAKVFCASMADVFEDHPRVVMARKRLFMLIEATPWLRWILLTKRAENIDRMIPPVWKEAGWPTNVWMLVSAEDQRRADQRVPLLLKTGAHVKGVSYEPALGPIVFGKWMPYLQWVIIGGESGNGARRFMTSWARFALAECQAWGVACFMKQFGALPYEGVSPIRLLDKKHGGDMAEWPPDLRVREFPRAA